MKSVRFTQYQTKYTKLTLRNPSTANRHTPLRLLLTRAPALSRLAELAHDVFPREGLGGGGTFAAGTGCGGRCGRGWWRETFGAVRAEEAVGAVDAVGVNVLLRTETNKEQERTQTRRYGSYQSS
jgi:hypothetical protein